MRLFRPDLVAWLSLVSSFAMLIAASVVFLFGFSVRFASPVESVLVNDQLSDGWAPAARPLDWEWFGDFSTYGLGALADHLCHIYPRVDVLREGLMTSELLARYDVLVIKTPRTPLARSEVRAVLQWVQKGGGLVCLGDHTNLGGMSSYLNELVGSVGMQFVFDAVADGADRSFTVPGRRGGWLPDPLLAAESQFMTGCSIQLRGDAYPLSVALWQEANPYDLAGSSHFAFHESDARGGIAPVCMIGGGNYGQGAVLACSDSTMFSSFAITTWGRRDLAVRMVEWAGRYRLVGRRSWLAAIVALVSMLAIWRTVRRLRLQERSAVVSVAVGLTVSGFLLTWYLSSGSVELPHQSKAEIAVWGGGGNAVVPPTLGGSRGSDLELSYSFDTLLCGVQRSGLSCIWQPELGDALRARAVIIINPAEPPRASDVSRLDKYVRDGGRLVVLFRRDLREGLGGLAWLRRFGIDVDGDENRWEMTGGRVVADIEPGVRAVAGRGDAGGVIVVSGSEAFSRVGLGHCFNWPTRAQTHRWQGLRAIVEAVAGDFQRRSPRIIVGQ